VQTLMLAGIIFGLAASGDRGQRGEAAGVVEA